MVENDTHDDGQRFERVPARRLFAFARRDDDDGPVSIREGNR